MVIIQIIIAVIILIIKFITIIIIIRPWPAFCQLGLGRSSGGKTSGGVTFGAPFGSEAIYIGTSPSIIIILKILIIIMIDMLKV